MSAQSDSSSLSRMSTPFSNISPAVGSKNLGIRFDVANQDLTDRGLRINRVFAMAMPTLMAILNLANRNS